MDEVHVWFNNAGNQVRITIPINAGDTVGDLKQTIDQAGNTPLSGVGAALINIWDHANGNLLPDAQALADGDELDATLANGAVC
jgi:hypothetical protein